MIWPGLLSRLIYPPRQRDSQARPEPEEIDAWVDTADSAHFEQLDAEFVGRALDLGVSSGMVLDLDSRLGLVAMKILWREEGLLGIGVYRSLELAERVRHTAEAWNLGDRMFFQVGDPVDLKFKTDYFDLVISDQTLHQSENASRLLREIDRVTKPTGAILLGQQARPSRFGIGKVLSRRRDLFPGVIGSRLESIVRAGYTRSELSNLVERAGLERVRVVASGERLFIERRGANDASSWVSEREKYD